MAKQFQPVDDAYDVLVKVVVGMKESLQGVFVMRYIIDFLRYIFARLYVSRVGYVVMEVGSAHCQFLVTRARKRRTFNDNIRMFLGDLIYGVV